MADMWRKTQAAAGRLIGRKPAPRFGLPELKRLHLPDLNALEIDWARGRRASRAGAIWPTLAAAAGAGVAFWWWNQWARGRAETELAPAPSPTQASPERERVDAEGGREGAAAPEAIMAHAPPPADEGSVEAPETPVPSAPAAKQLLKSAPAKSAPAKVETVPPAAREALDESLSVQAAPSGPKRRARPRGEASE